MSCIKNGIIQKYVDGEANLKEVDLIERHIANCEKCAWKVSRQQKLVTGIKKAINLLSVDNVEKPKLVMPVNSIKKLFLTKERIICSISAACILVFVFIFFHQKKSDNQDQISIIYSIGPEIDANRPITEQEMIINVIDTKGNITEYYIK